MKSVKLTHYLIQALQDENASHVFMIPGGFVDNFSQDLVDVDGITPIVCASEAGAAMMADGFARAAKRFGICLGISGPGATNMITGLGIASADRIPILVITGDNPLAWRNRDSIQDADTQGLRSNELLRNLTQRQYQIYSAQLAGDYLRRSMTTLKGMNSGVAHIAVPMDIQSDKIPYDYLPLQRFDDPHTDLIDNASLERTRAAINEHDKVAVLAGAGVRKSRATEELIKFAERYSLPVATTMSAKGDFPEDHPLSLGVFGWAGSRHANETLINGEIDCLIVIGSRLGQIATMSWTSKLADSRTLIHIDIDPYSLDQSYTSDCAIVADAGSAMRYFITRDKRTGTSSDVLKRREMRLSWLSEIRRSGPWHYDTEHKYSNCSPIHPARAITTLSSLTDANTQVFVDNGAHTFFTSHYWLSTRPNQFFNTIKYSGAMGWAIPSSIGGKIAQPDKTTIAIVGDGCMLMQGMEIQTAARYKLKGMIFVVLNNKAHGNPKLRTGGFTSDAEGLTDIVDHNWAGFAKSLGLKGMTIEQPEQLKPVFTKALECDSPVLIDLKCGLYPTPTKVFDETFMNEFNQYIHN